MRRIAVAMSGGVDSSVTAALLTQKGVEVVGVTMLLKGPDKEYDPAAMAADEVCKKLGIEHKTFDMRDDFKSLVIDYFLDGYIAGVTPNPCIRCNEYLKFGTLLKLIDLIRAERLATGHYARSLLDKKTNSLVLLKALDDTKDQSYFLYRLTQRQLDRVSFPLGEMTKTEVRKLAVELGLDCADAGESQDICFVDGDDYGEYIRRMRKDSVCPGEFVDEDGKPLGEHEGIAFYTIGQRRGMGVSSAEGRLYVVDKDPKTRRITLGTKETLEQTAITVGRLNFISGMPPVSEVGVSVKFRNKMEPAKAMLIPLADDTVSVIFMEPQHGIAPGQAAVFYIGDRVMGGGEILAGQGR